MKFVEAIKALEPGQLLINPTGARLEIRDGVLWLLGMSYPPDRVLYQDRDGWKVEDKPRPRVKFAEAMRAALEGKVIRSISEMEYKLTTSGFVFASTGDHTYIGTFESKGDWEIIEAEDGK